MEEKTILEKEQLAQISGGADGTGGNVGSCDTGQKCPKCGSNKVRFVGELSDMGKYECEDCGCTFYGDI